MRLSGDILWLGVTALAGAAIIGILCWPVSATLSPHLLTGATAASTTVRAAPEPGANSGGITLASVYSASRDHTPVAAPTRVEGSGELASHVALITSIVAPAEPNDSKLSPLDPNAGRSPAETPSNRASLTPALRAPLNHSATAPSPSHQLGSLRARQPHQQAQSAGRSQKSEPVPQ